MALPQSTVKLLEELESSSDQNHLRGFEAEILVIKHYLLKGYSLLNHRKKYFKTEVDIIMESSTKIILIEVKYTTHSDYIFHRMSKSQRLRLENVFLSVVESTSKEVEFHYVVVSQSQEMIIFDDFLGSSI